MYPLLPPVVVSQYRYTIYLQLQRLFKIQIVTKMVSKERKTNNKCANESPAPLIRQTNETD